MYCAIYINNQGHITLKNDYLYQYRTFSSDKNRHVNNLINSELSFAIGEAFNDPFDATLLFPSIFATDVQIEQFIDKNFQHIVLAKVLSESKSTEIVKHELKQRFSQPEGQKIFLDRYQAPIQERMCNSYISCLSTSSRNPLLWAHYGDNHEGFCVRYNKEKLVNSLPLRCHNEVIYTNNPMNFLDTITNSCDIKKQVDKLLFKKSKHWDYEQEYRLVMEQRRTELSSKYFTHSFDPQSVNMVLFGLKASAKFKEDLYSKLQGRGIIFKEMLADSIGFELYADTDFYVPR
jgi:hypothetical protein